MLAPHSIAWMNELFRDIGKIVCKNIVFVSHGLMNPEVLQKVSFHAKWKRIVESLQC